MDCTYLILNPQITPKPTQIIQVADSNTVYRAALCTKRKGAQMSHKLNKVGGGAINFEASFCDAKSWMLHNFPFLNSDKPEKLVIGPAQHRHQETLTLCVGLNQRSGCDRAKRFILD